MSCCSTCGQRLPKSRLLIDLNGNCITMDQRVVHLRPRDAEVLQVLYDASPRFISSRFIEERVLGLEAEERCEEWVRVRIAMLRKRLAGLPLRIRNRHGIGYALEEISAPAEAQ